MPCSRTQHGAARGMKPGTEADALPQRSLLKVFVIKHEYVNRDARKPVFGVSDKV